tara:strand:+ start:32 stop:406 length:375 start_codon:yes stop_codon:yes gene_type:complete
MAIVISRSETQLAATGAFQAMDNIGTASVSSSFTVPQGVSSIKSLTISVTADGAEEFVPLIKVSGNAMRDGDAVFAGSPSYGAVAMDALTYDTDLAVQPGNSCEFSIAVTDNATISAVVSAQFA